MSYRVIWTIDIDDADSPLEAAEEALRIQRDPDSIATIFEVTDSNGHLSKIDLSPEDR